MWSLPTPTRTAADTFELCISRVRSKELRDRLAAIIDQIAAASTQFSDRVRANDVCSIPLNDAVGTVSGEELEDVYTQRLVPARGPGRIIYDELIASAPNGRCPLCGHRQVTTLDHFLPKSKYRALTVTPLNLVPSCADCNHVKLDVVPATEEEVTLHPYFDDVEGDRWLYATVEETAPASATFFVAAPNHWSQQLRARVGHHFDVLHLSRLYSAQAAEEVLNVRFELDIVLNATGWRSVSDHLSLAAESRERAHRNSWQTALYWAWSRSEWFCRGGFQ